MHTHTHRVWFWSRTCATPVTTGFCVPTSPVALAWSAKLMICKSWRTAADAMIRDIATVVRRIWKLGIVFSINGPAKTTSDIEPIIISTNDNRDQQLDLRCISLGKLLWVVSWSPIYGPNSASLNHENQCVQLLLLRHKRYIQYNDKCKNVNNFLM